jgi:hypothetical protein
MRFAILKQGTFLGSFAKLRKGNISVSINKRLGSLNTIFTLILLRRKKQLHDSAHDHHQVGSFGLGEKILFATPCWVSQFTMIGSCVKTT